MFPTKQQRKRGTYKLVDGIWHKRCTGAAHTEPTYLPATEKYFYWHRSGPQINTPTARCRLCTNWTRIKDPHPERLTGWVPIQSVRPFYIEAVNRIGTAELARRTGVTALHIYRVLNHKHKKYVEKTTLRKIMLELVSIQRKNEHSAHPRARYFNNKRNYRGLQTCNECGGYIENMTAHCDACRDRHYNRYKNGQITEKEWNAMVARADINTAKLEN